ncbi:MAG: hypothetical protein GTN81_04855 [Proteobacteria bacterium]|nr:hypothetical protein [Pseudomonadota bacterium]
MKWLLFYGLLILTRIFSDVPLFWMFYSLHFQEEGRGGISNAVFNGVLFVSFGVIHSLMARNRVKKYVAKLVGDDLVRIVYVVIAGVTLSLVLHLWRPVGGMVWHTQGILYWILSVLYLGLIGGIIYSTFFIDYLEFIGIRHILRKMKNRSPKAPRFSAKGPYAHCHHPMYLFLFMALWVGPVMTVGRFEFALFGSAYLVVGTFLEEGNLREELGEVYDIYRANVPMWIPQLRP